MLDLCGVPEFFCSGLMRVCVLPGDIVRFVLCRELENGDQEPIVAILMPMVAVEPALDKIMSKLGARVVDTRTPMRLLA